jgi:hypothetical protein
MPWYGGIKYSLSSASFFSVVRLVLFSNSLSRQLKILATPVPAGEASLQHRLVTVVSIKSNPVAVAALPSSSALLPSHSYPICWLTSLTHHD